MKAIVYREYGAPDVLQLAEVDEPKPKNDEILIRVRAAEVTKTDCELRSFRFPVKWFWLPLRLALGVLRPRRPILGGYFSGEVEAVGDAVKKFKPGDAVYGSSQLRLGAYGEFLCVPASYTVVPKPTKMTFEEAAAVAVAALTVYDMVKAVDRSMRITDIRLVHKSGGKSGVFEAE